MKPRNRIPLITAVAALVWISVMGMVYLKNYRDKTGQNLTALSADVTARGEERRYYIVYRDGLKAGYLIASRISLNTMKILREEVVLKVNLAGLSREIFLQNTAGVDSANMRMEYFEFRLQSGAHTFLFNSSLHEDSLLINVKMNGEFPWRRGAFIVDRGILPLISLPFFLRYSGFSGNTAQVFDPVTFAPRDIKVVRGETETLRIGGESHKATRYEIGTGDDRSIVWIDSLGWTVRQENVRLFGEALGVFTIEESTERDVFYLPVETTLGQDIRTWSIPVEKEIPNPRTLEYLKVQLSGIRGATVDTGSSNKEILGMNPVVFGIHRRPVAAGERLREIFNSVAADTSLLGTTDYIQPKDARIVRVARDIPGAEADTLSAARAIGRWVRANVRQDSSAVTARSVDVLRSRKGGPDEYTKLFAALARSMGIRTQVNTGLVYEGNRFRYHSWPSVFVGGAWRDLDPWYGQDTADAARIALVRGDFERLDELFRFVGVLDVTVMEFRQASDDSVLGSE